MAARFRTFNLFMALLIASTLSLNTSTFKQVHAEPDAISAGAIAVIGYDTDNPDAVTFVALEDLTAGEVIRFTDSGWLSTDAFRGNEGGISYTVPIGGLAAGSVISKQDPFDSDGWAIDDDSIIGTSGFSLSGFGEQILAFQGLSSAPTFLHAVNGSEETPMTDGWQDESTSSNTSTLPMGLSEGTTAIGLFQTSAETDNARYNCEMGTSGKKSELLALINNRANWLFSDSPSYGLYSNWANCPASFTITETAPDISSTTPANNATAVPTTSNIVIVFNEEVTITPGSFFDIFCDAVEQPGTVSGSGTTYTINPTNDLPQLASSCVVTIYASAVSDQDTDDPPDNMAADYIFSFATAEDLAPAVLSTLPANASNNIALNSSITVNFSEPVDVDVDNWYSISCDNSGSHVAMTTGGPTSYTLDPVTDFWNDEDCDVTILAAYVSDQDSNDLPDEMVSNQTWYFSTLPVDSPPEVLSVTPLDNSTGIPVATTLSITFSEPVTVTSSFASINCSYSGAHSYGINQAGDPTIVLTPDLPFNVGEVCTVTVDNEKVTDEDFLPDNLVEDYIWDFTTVYDPAPFVVGVIPLDGTTRIAIDANLVVDFSEDVVVIGDWYTISCATSGNHSATVTGVPDAYTINPDDDFTYGELCTITLENTLIEDVDSQDPYDKMAVDYTWSFTTTPCGNTHTLISDIQGSGTASPMNDDAVILEGIVVADMQGSDSLNGYFIQSLAVDEDTDPLTSEGVMIYNNTAVDLGDIVRVAGTVTEYQNLTEIGSVTSTFICSSGNPLPSPVVINLPDTANDTFTLEPYEGMLVTIPETLTVQQNYFQARYGQVTLGAGGRIAQMNNVSLGGGSLYEYTRMIILDDANSNQNVNPTSYYGVDDFMRAGDTIVGGITGIIDQGSINNNSGLAFPYNYYRLQPVTVPAFTRTNPRPTSLPDVSGTLKVVGFNTLNYFTTLDMAPYRTTPPYGGSNTPRGADSAVEFIRQQDKLLSALAAMDADVVGLMELESWDAAAAPQALVTALNTYLAGSATYAVVPDPLLGHFDIMTDGDSDYIQVGLIYKTDTVSLLGDSLSVDDVIFDRSPFAQVFMENATGERFVVVANHFKSKGSCPTDGSLNEDQGDGQGCWNARRVLQAEALLDFITDTLVPLDPDVMVIGDLNAYGGEDPIQALVDGGLIDQIASHIPIEDRYSFVFDGAAGYLDHFLSTPAMDAQITGADFYHINADEISFIDYNTEYKGGSYSPDLYQVHPFRSSDHDPVMAGLDLMSPLELTALELLGSLNGGYFDAVYGNLSDGYILPLDPTLEFQYLDAGTYTVTRTLTDGYYPFYLDETTVPPGYYDYWLTRGVFAGCGGTWEPTMWQIISGNAPMFYLKVAGAEYTLVDGLTYLLGGGDTPLRVSGDYPLGDFNFTGTISDLWGGSATVAVSITFEALPDITSLELLGSLDAEDWSVLSGTIDSGYTYRINTRYESQFLDAGSYAVNKTLADGYYGFYLDETAVPAGFFAYWAAKGVVSGASGWQGVMWQIINGNQPMFYLKVAGSEYALMDGLTRLMGGGDAPFHISGDYPPGTYHYSGTVEDLHYGLGTEVITITFERFHLNFLPVLRK
jgi:predicted extracellular nuclease